MNQLPRTARRLTATALTAALVGTGLLTASAASAAEEPTTIDTLFDFEDGTTGTGYFQYEAAGAGAEPIRAIGDGTGFDASANTHALSFRWDITQAPYFGGIGWNAPTGSWDWSGYDGIQFWAYGDGSGASFQVELQDNASGGTQPELFDTVVPTGDAGWRLVRIPFEDIKLATDYNPAVDNGVLDLDSVMAIALPANGGNGVVKLDSISLYAGGDVAASLSIASASAIEGADASVTVSLSKAAASDVTFDYATADGTALAGTDYTAASGSLIIPAGETSATITVATIDNDTVDGNRAFTVALSNASGATLGTATATVTVRDNDAVSAEKLTLLHQVSEDFEQPLIDGDATAVEPIGWFPVSGAGNDPVYERVVDATRPGAAPDNKVLDVQYDTRSWAVLINNFSDDGVNWATQDWAQNRSIGFWMNGSNSGTRFFLDVLDNRNAGSERDDAERFTSTFNDDFVGWKFIELPLADFARKDVGNGAPNDGFTLNEIHGFAIGVEQGDGPANVKFDDFVVVKFQDKVEDFEGDVPAAQGTPPVGWTAVSGAGNDPVYTQVTDASHPLALDGNTVLDVEVNTASWGALVRTFGEGTTWTSQDWAGHTGVGFWFLGEGSGATYALDILDNRNQGSTSDDAGRWAQTFVDDTAGWKFVELPFANFARKDIGNGAPDDGFTLNEIHGYGFAHEGGAGDAQTFRVDDITLLGSADRAKITVNFDGSQFSVNEGDDAQITVKLNNDAPEDITINYETVPFIANPATTARVAVDGRDYTGGAASVTIPAGERTAVISIPTTADGKPEIDEKFTVKLHSASTDAAVNTASTATVTIIDADEANPSLIDDFEYGLGQWKSEGAAVREIPADADDAREEQYAYDHVVDLAPGDDGRSTLERSWVVPTDLSAGEGLGFWYNGTGSGEHVTASVRDAGESESEAGDWEVAWADEFDGAAGTGANPDNWRHEFNGHGWGNQEFQYYTDSRENSAHDGEGHFVISLQEVTDQEVFREQVAESNERNGLNHPGQCSYNPSNPAGSPDGSAAYDCAFTSARLITEGKVDFQYGRVESRAQLPDGKKGIWPAIWALGSDFFEQGWPASGEIDIMEFVGKQPNEVFGTIHGPGYNGGNAIHNTHDFGENLGNRWMRFAIEWEPEEIRWYVALDSAEDVEDGEWHHFHTATKQQVLDRGGEWVFDKPQFLIMNFAIGGNFGGPLAADLEFPQEFKVDYIRILRPSSTGHDYSYTFEDDVEGWRFVQLPFEGFESEAADADGLDLTRVTALSISAPAPASVDHVQVLETVTAATPPFEPGAPGPGEPTPTDTAAPTPTPTPTGGGLPNTGAELPGVLVALAIALVAAGGVLVARRRAARPLVD